MTTDILPLWADISLILVFIEFWVAVLLAFYSTIHSLIIKKDLKGTLTLFTGLALISPCVALAFFPKNNSLLAVCLIIPCTLIVIAIICILLSTILNLLKK